MSLGCFNNLATPITPPPATRVAPVQADKATYPERVRICPLMGVPISALFCGLGGVSRLLSRYGLQGPGTKKKKTYEMERTPINTPTARPCACGGAILLAQAFCRLMTAPEVKP